ELERVVDALDLERDVVGPDESRHGTSVASGVKAGAWLNPSVAIRGVYETVMYAADVPAAATFYADVLGLRLVDGPDELAAGFRLDDRGVLLIFDPSRASRPGRPVPSHGASGAGHIAFSVEDGTLDVCAETLRGRGIEIEREIEWDRGGRSRHVRAHRVFRGTRSGADRRVDPPPRRAVSPAFGGAAGVEGLPRARGSRGGSEHRDHVLRDARGDRGFGAGAGEFPGGVPGLAQGPAGW